MILNGESSCFEAGSRGFGHEAEYPRVWKAPRERRETNDKGTILNRVHFAEGRRDEDCLVAVSCLLHFASSDSRRDSMEQEFVEAISKSVRSPACDPFRIHLL